ncbi:nuclear transport factor 2 family protein [Hydrogenophaga sp. D2P1]|uniref:Nuclear transport factor 2 family protein n=1 Tax=Hydrogenophaga aromaticivorans TaxID=2610898 RepID=A0A7Y8KXL6_9BURK|nr:nuclear transport factor 2 family protein [Hydrogenophaga aromaticivorans]NWF46755.1 nuclear transport factor 2 family protein [Hydrogenophaga aromaticivorans]
MTALKLPEPIAAYFSADQQNPDALVRCFTAQATVKDEGQTHTGLDAIQAWKAAASTQYAYTTEPFALDQDNGHHIVSSRVAGNFPGSPVNLRYRFRLERGLIASLEITA